MTPLTKDEEPVMAEREALLALADACEKATGADKAIDQAIGDMLWQNQPANVFDCYQLYTNSLDAAMTLVPEGSGFNLDRYWIRDGARWKAEIATGGIPANLRQVFDCWDACTAPLAVVVAALRARAFRRADDGGAAEADHQLVVGAAQAQATADGFVRMTLHSPGPWSLDGNDRRDDAQMVLSDQTGCPIGEAFLQARTGECEANARLFASAPNLHAALVEALPVLMIYLRGDLNGGCKTGANGEPDRATLDANFLPLVLACEAAIASANHALRMADHG